MILSKFSNGITLYVYSYLPIPEKNKMYVSCQVFDGANKIAEMADMLNEERIGSNISFSGAAFHSLKLGLEYIHENNLSNRPLLICTYSKTLSCVMQDLWPVEYRKTKGYRELATYCKKYVRENFKLVSYQFLDKDEEKNPTLTIYKNQYGEK